MIKIKEFTARALFPFITKSLFGALFFVFSFNLASQEATTDLLEPETNPPSVFLEPEMSLAPKTETSWYFSLETGYAWSMDAQIQTKGSTWVPTVEGLSSSLGSVPFSSLGIGKKWTHWLENSISYTYYQPFHYTKHQTPLDASVGNRMRIFSLNSQNLLFNLGFNPISCWLQSDSYIPVSLICGVGIGIANNQVGNFYQIAYQSSGEVGSVLTIGTAVNQIKFAWQGSVGLRIKPFDAHFVFDLGYRYYSNGSFSTNSHVMTNNGQVRGNLEAYSPWTGPLQMNSIFLSVNASW